MDIYEKMILKEIYINQFISQKNLSSNMHFSINVISRSIKNLKRLGYLNEFTQPTPKAKYEIEQNKPKQAVILAAGFGMRMVPINTEVTKGLIEVNKEPLIERIIKQLHESGIYEIYIVVGFLKEKYEYLIDEYGIELIINPKYAEKNNLHSLNLAKNHLINSYIIPCDIWCLNNPFSNVELYSWYMVSDSLSSDSNVKVNRMRQLRKISNNDTGNTMKGICYLNIHDAMTVKSNLESMCQKSKYDNCFWEEVLYSGNKMFVAAKIVSDESVYEINTYEQLREIDNSSNQLNTVAIQLICSALNVNTQEITNISVLKKGMTNRSFIFTCRGKKYIMRIPGEGTDCLINRKHESDVYKIIDKLNICDDIVYIDDISGYKITKYLDKARVCDPLNPSDVKKCMKVLKDFHDRKLKVSHEFDVFYQIEFYESLWTNNESIYKDYSKTKECILLLKTYIESCTFEKVLTHIDANADNFLFSGQNQDVRLIDWEYAGMQDPHLDIAMFAIYSLYDRQQIDWLISVYFDGDCDTKTRIKIYAYIAVGGLLWSNWCEYKQSVGVEFGEYSIRQYRYAKEFYKIVKLELQNIEKEYTENV